MSKIFFSKEDCEYIKSFWDDDLRISGKEYNIVKSGLDTLVIRHDANGYCVNQPDEKLIRFILDRVKDTFIKSISLGSVKLVKYSKGDYFAPHRDYHKYDIGTVRKTVIIQLTNESDYEGGTLLINGIPQSRIQGTLIDFNSSELHEVTEVTNGTRYSLVLFLFDQDIKFDKTLL